MTGYLKRSSMKRPPKKVPNNGGVLAGEGVLDEGANGGGALLKGVHDEVGAIEADNHG